MSKIMKTMDGNTAAAYVSYAFTEVAAIYPITPSSPMAETVDEMSAHGKKNLFGQPVKVVEMQSEGGASGTLHGSLQSGALTTTYTASQGLLLMIPNMYKIAGELLPAVFHVSARALATSSLSIFGDHQDVMAVRPTGFAILAESSVQEVMDLSAVAHLTAIKGRVPFVNFFDGFRTSHEIQKIEVLDYENLRPLLDIQAVEEFRQRALNPDHPVVRGTSQNPDIYFQEREAVNRYYLAIPDLVEKNMQEINKLTGRNYHLFNYHGAKDADRVIIAMGSVCQTAEEVAAYLNARGEKVGVINVHLYRPFSIKHLLQALPKTVQKIAVLDRTKEPGAEGEPLYIDVKNALYDAEIRPQIIGGRYGLGSKDVFPADILAVFAELKKDKPKNNFTIGITDDVTYTSLTNTETVDLTPAGTTACKFWGLGSDGTVGANKSAIKIIGDNTDMYAQAYFAYDSKKSGGLTMSHLRFGKEPIHAPYLVHEANFISCSQQSYLKKYAILEGLKPGGTFLLNTHWEEEDLTKYLPANVKKFLAENKIHFYTVNATKIARELGLGGRFNMVMQAAFFKLTNIIPLADAVRYLKEAIVKSYGRKGQNVVDMNFGAVDAGINAVTEITIPDDWANATEETTSDKDVPDFIKNILVPMNRQDGNKLPVSTFANGMEDGTFPLGTAAFEKPGNAVQVPEWVMDNCIQCCQCSFVCPHAAIRPVLLSSEEQQNAPAGMESKPALGAPGNSFRIVISTYDCTGCNNCVNVCPAPKGKALVMQPFQKQVPAQEYFDYAVTKVQPKKNPLNKNTLKGSQFEKPLLEFSGACAGCGETPYIKLITQLFGDRMMVANATGCSSIWGASAPSIPYTTNHCGHGPAWANSLFEDNAEYGYGMLVGTSTQRDALAHDIKTALTDTGISEKLRLAFQNWLTLKDEGENSRARADFLSIVLREEKGENPLLNKIYAQKDRFVKRSQWIFGGDGWAYDIGFGGLDHVLASGEDINIIILDTEVYSNTGGQSSKATPAAAIAKFAASGKKTKKKDLGMIAMSYGYVYVAQINMGADKNQALKAIVEAEKYPGPSLIIAYAPCINHGIRIGMGQSQQEAKRAVECGYWANYRYNPLLKDTDKNPFSLDSKEPTGNFRDFLMGEVRYSSLQKLFPDKAEALFAKTERDAKERLAVYKKLAGK